MYNIVKLIRHARTLQEMPRTKHKHHRKRYHAKLKTRIGRHYIVTHHDDASPFVHGMARAVDIGGLLRTTNVDAARNFQGRHVTSWIPQNHDAITTHRVLGNVGTYFKRVIGHPISGVAPAKTENGKSFR